MPAAAAYFDTSVVKGPNLFFGGFRLIGHVLPQDCLKTGIGLDALWAPGSSKFFAFLYSGV